MSGFRYIGPIGFGRGNRLGGLFDRTRQDQENAQLGAMFGIAPSITPSGGLTYGGLSKSTLMGTARTGMPPTMMADGKKYTLQEDTQSYNRIMAGEREAARRSNRPVQNISPTYRYVDEQGKPFAGTFLGGGSYGGFGGGGPQSSQRSWSNYVEPTGPRNPDYGSNPRKRAMAEAAQEGPASEGSSGREGYVRNRFGYLEPAEWYTEEDGVTRKKRSDEYRPKSTQSAGYMSDQYGSGYSRSYLGFAGDPLSFTYGSGRSFDIKPSPTTLSTPPPFPVFSPTNILTSNQFGGYPMFPYANY